MGGLVVGRVVAGLFPVPLKAVPPVFLTLHRWQGWSASAKSTPNGWQALEAPASPDLHSLELRRVHPAVPAADVLQHG